MCIAIEHDKMMKQAHVAVPSMYEKQNLESW